MFKHLLSALALTGALVTGVQPAPAGTIIEDFSSDPAAHGWEIAGHSSLFQWDATHQDLEVTWDSSRPNTLFYRPLGTVLSRSDDFSLGFDLRLRDIGIGVNTNKTFPIELAIGFLNHAEATRTNFIRGTGTDSPDLVEFDYFWDAGYGATVWPECVSSNSSFNFNGSTDYLVLALASNTWYRAVMTYTASNQSLVTTLTNLATLAGATITSPLNTNFADFRVDTIAVSSYSDAGDAYDSLLAHAEVDNLVVTVPPPPITTLMGPSGHGVRQVQFASRSNWVYSLESSVSLQSWSAASAAQAGSGLILTLQDTNPPAANAFYRVRADKP